jgi:hypothetical protein
MGFLEPIKTQEKETFFSQASSEYDFIMACIPYVQPARCHFSQFIYFNNALLVSVGTSTHHQELGLYIQLLVFVKV